MAHTTLSINIRPAHENRTFHTGISVGSFVRRGDRFGPGNEVGFTAGIQGTQVGQGTSWTGDSTLRMQLSLRRCLDRKQNGRLMDKTFSIRKFYHCSEVV